MRHELAPAQRLAGPGTPESRAAVPEGVEWFFWRSIVILGPHDRIDREALRRSLGPRCSHLLLLSVGYPPTPDQRGAVRLVMRLAAERGIPVEARLAWTMDEALDFLSPLDDVLPCLARD